MAPSTLQTRKEYARRLNAAFESYVGEPEGTPEKRRFVFDLYVPVKPLE